MKAQIKKLPSDKEPFQPQENLANSEWII